MKFTVHFGIKCTYLQRHPRNGTKITSLLYFDSFRYNLLVVLTKSLGLYFSTSTSQAWYDMEKYNPSDFVKTHLEVVMKLIKIQEGCYSQYSSTYQHIKKFTIVFRRTRIFVHSQINLRQDTAVFDHKKYAALKKKEY